MSTEYRILRVAESRTEEELTAASRGGWEVISVYVTRLQYGLGGAYHAIEVGIALRRPQPQEDTPAALDG